MQPEYPEQSQPPFTSLEFVAKQVMILMVTGTKISR